MMIKKILSTLMCICVLFFPSIKVSANPGDEIVKECANCTCSWLVVAATAVVSGLTSGYVGYRLGLRNYFRNNRNQNYNIVPNTQNQDKIITIIRPIDPQAQISPPGKHRFDLLALDYINNQLFGIEIPRLRASSEPVTLTGQRLTNLGSIYGVIYVSLGNIAESKGNTRAGEISQRLSDIRINIYNLVTYDKQISLKYLVNLLNEVKSLLEEAGPIIERNSI